jgi:hypothetical protein
MSTHLRLLFISGFLALSFGSWADDDSEKELNLSVPYDDFFEKTMAGVFDCTNCASNYSKSEGLLLLSNTQKELL